ncbi:MAG: thioredoxin domain-containing protein [SAR202 cluster bacterium]|nr:MAG: thioredoxin domain-containing protein [SAR202 cluster bacterium]
MSDLRFSTNPNDAHLIDWQPWGPAAFAKAQEEDKPVLLSISAVWCYWCHVMDETTYTDPDVQEIIRENFVAVRVDNDHRPDINSRYNVGGWPTTGFLTGHGGLIGGATYLPPDQLISMMAELIDAYKNDRPTLYTQARDLLGRRREHARRTVAGPELEELIVDRVSRIVAGAYDATNGGFGSEPKFPNASIVRSINHLYRTSGEDFYASMLTKTLVEMSEGEIWDDVDGGFFRHCAQADWTQPQHEKMLDDNLNLTRQFLNAGILLERPEFTETAKQTIKYLLNQLYDSTALGFRGSQGAHSEYYSLPAEIRAESGAPNPDPSCYANSNALAVTVLLDAAWKLGDMSIHHTALQILGNLDTMAQSGSFSHVYTAEGPSSVPALFTDWAWLLTALIQAHGNTANDSYLTRALSVAQVLVENFFDQEGGGFFDISEQENQIGHLTVREKALADNTVAAEALIRLYQTTRNDDYRQIAEATLSAFVEGYRENGEFAAEYGLTVHLLKNPMVEVTIEGNPEDIKCQELVAAAARLPQPNVDIKTVIAAEDDPIALAHVCLDTVCLPPVVSPEALADAVSELTDEREPPFQDIFKVFPGN